MKTVLTVVGARPQFVKAAVVSRALRKTSQYEKEKIQELLIHTGQHYDANMSKVFFEQMSIPTPSHNLAIRAASHGKMTGRMLEALETYIKVYEPHLVLVYGDTNSTLAGALAAVKLHIPIAHVEAGLRSFNIRMPEEVNRILTDRISTLLFCPSQVAVDNLVCEGIGHFNDRGIPHQVELVGDVMFDAIQYYLKRLQVSTTIEDFVGRLDRYYLATVHRQENTDDPAVLARVIAVLDSAAKQTPIIIPMHPRTQKRVQELGIPHAYLHIIEPVGYFDMLYFLSNCQAIITDSGGLQKEAFFCGKPCITLRNETEWTELVDLGVNCLVGSDPGKITAALTRSASMKIDKQARPYGDGKAGEKITSSILEFLSVY